MIKKLAFLLVSIWGLAGLSVRAQDPHFSQFYANPLYLNPAFSGVAKCPKVHLNYRNQYPTLGVYQTFSASYDQYFDGIRGGLGFLVLRDEAADGTLSLTEASAMYSYHLKVNRKFSILAGFQATFRQRALDNTGLTFPDQIEPFYGFVRPTAEVLENTTNQHLDLTFGFLGYTERFYFGGVVSHLTEPNEAFLTESKLPRKYTFHAGATIPLGKRRLYNTTQNMLIPHVVYQQQSTAFQLTAGLSFNRGPITGGLALRHGNANPDALVLIVGFAPDNIPWTIGYSYDYTISNLTNALGGAHEISLSYRFPCPQKRKRREAIKCPKF